MTYRTYCSLPQELLELVSEQGFDAVPAMQLS